MENKPLTSILQKAFAAAIFSLSGHAALAQPSDVVLPSSSPFPESMSSAADGTLYASSITNGGIARALPNAKTATQWIRAGAFGSRSTFGVLADDQSNTLFVCSNDATALGITGPSDIKGAYVKTFNLQTGAPKDSIAFPPGPAICNDFARASDGSVIVTNTAGAELLRLKPGAKQLDRWLKDDRLKGGPDGLAFDKKGDLLVNTFLSGELFLVHVQDGKPVSLTKLATSRPLFHPDGLKSINGGFVMVEGAGTLDLVTILGDRADLETIGHYAGPTGVTLVGNTVWVAEGQIGAIAKVSKDPAAMPSFRLRSSQLPVK